MQQHKRFKNWFVSIKQKCLERSECPLTARPIARASNRRVNKAARAVAATNEKLLALLRIHGVQDAEIDAFLREPVTGEQNMASDASSGVFDRAAHSRSGSLRPPVIRGWGADGPTTIGNAPLAHSAI
ncbi:hypothetical protein PG991_009293 [Apiospora marii]|uniref:Uncharacterized protein n=1 Tax=Apiospora marii TaxID=335849 RepID=A0ABR1RK29_9PEZI